MSELSLISSLLIGILKLLQIWLYKVYFKILNMKIN